MRLDPATWAQELVATARTESPGPTPRYGTPEWAAAPAPQRWASVVIAAEAWRTDSENVAENLRVELDATCLADKRAEDTEYADRVADWQQRWSGRGFKRDPWLEVQVRAEWNDWAAGGAAS